jgi:hypothetical protein
VPRVAGPAVGGSCRRLGSCATPEDTGPATEPGAGAAGNAIDGDACGTDMSTGGKARVLHCTAISGSIECVPETGGLVTASQHLSSAN